MKKPSALFLLSVAGAFLIGGISAWLLFHEKPLKLQVLHRPGGIRVYTYYVSSSGDEVHHGWSYDYRSDGETMYEDQERYVDGKQVFSGHKTEYHSNMPDPAWAFKNK